jgi:hypothetical protein
MKNELMSVDAVYYNIYNEFRRWPAYGKEDYKGIGRGNT